MRLIDADALYEQTAEWEASALHHIEELNRTPLAEMDDDERFEWRKWSAILAERSAFKHDVADAPTVDAVEVVRCKDCKHWLRALSEDGRIEYLNYSHCEKGLYGDGHNWFCADGETSTADVKPVVRGEWIYDEMVCKARCSACDAEWSWISNEMDRFNFCPNCGARMKGEDDGI